ncbi:hypothetical protein C8R46DRAFT_1343087 [Mycena filopes]|nr:hypothetical protein C8R46DRAFT_1343087 [Mycena filopes]
MPPQLRNGGTLRLAASRHLNTTGLPALPVELLHEIVSHLPCTPVPCLSWYYVLSEDHLARSTALRVLSEICRRLRSVFLARAWRHVEISLFPLDLADELVRKMNILTTHNPALAAEVRTFSVALSDSSADTVFPQLIRCLSLLPNLETLQITRAPLQYRQEYLHSVFAGHTFPSVRTLVLHDTASKALLCCPNAERLYLKQPLLADPSEWHHRLPKLRVLYSVYIPPKMVAEVVKYFPNLVEMPPITIGTSDLALTPDHLRSLAKIPNLRRIDLVEMNAAQPDTMLLSLIAVAQQVLSGNSSDAPQKCVTLKIGDSVLRYPRVSKT